MAAPIGSLPTAPVSVATLLALILRENQLLRLLAAGKTTTEIAQRLGISTKTVRNYLSNLYAKLAVEDRARAALAARQALEPKTNQ